MAGNANSGRKRTPIPTGKEAEEELRRLRRQERRRERAARKRAAARGEAVPEEDESTTDHPSPVLDGNLKPPSAEELKADLMYAFNQLGGRAGLVAWGRRYPKEFYALWMKHCLPKEDSDEEQTGLEGMLATLDKRRKQGESVN